MKERTQYFSRLDKNADVKALLQKRVGQFQSNPRVTNHAYEMHSKVNLMNVDHNAVVSYFEGGKERMNQCILAVVKRAGIGLVNFLAATNEGTLVLYRTFKNKIGYVLTDEDTIETKKICCVISKESDGNLFVKTAYPVV